MRIQSRAGAPVGKRLDEGAVGGKAGVHVGKPNKKDPALADRHELALGRIIDDEALMEGTDRARAGLLKWAEKEITKVALNPKKSQADVDKVVDDVRRTLKHVSRKHPDVMDKVAPSPKELSGLLADARKYINDLRKPVFTQDSFG